MKIGPTNQKKINILKQAVRKGGKRSILDRKGLRLKGVIQYNTEILEY